MAKKMHPEWQRGYDLGHRAAVTGLERWGEPFVQAGLDALKNDGDEPFDRGYYAGYKDAYDNRYKDKQCPTNPVS